MKSLILYYSYGGNTRKITEMIHHRIGGDIAEIETIKPYTGSYDEVVNQGNQEVNDGFMPQIKAINLDLSCYDTIILGSPVWWYTFAPAMKTFLNNYNLSNKKVYPYATNGGWIGHTFEDFEQACHSCVVKNGLNVRFDKNNLITLESEINKWIDLILVSLK